MHQDDNFDSSFLTPLSNAHTCAAMKVVSPLGRQTWDAFTYPSTFSSASDPINTRFLSSAREPIFVFVYFMMTVYSVHWIRISQCLRNQISDLLPTAINVCIVHRYFFVKCIVKSIPITLRHIVFKMLKPLPNFVNPCMVVPGYRGRWFVATRILLELSPASCIDRRGCSSEKGNLNPGASLHHKHCIMESAWAMLISLSNLFQKSLNDRFQMSISPEYLLGASQHHQHCIISTSSWYQFPVHTHSYKSIKSSTYTAKCPCIDCGCSGWDGRPQSHNTPHRPACAPVACECAATRVRYDYGSRIEYWWISIPFWSTIKD